MTIIRRDFKHLNCDGLIKSIDFGIQQIYPNILYKYKCSECGHEYELKRKEIK